MSIQGLEGLTTERINYELQRGAKFVIYEYCISVLILTFRRPSRLFFIKADESRLRPGLAYILLSLACGWWGFPWGPIYTIGALYTNLTGGKDVTADVLASINTPSAEA
ncbi:MAG: hypothetical protein JNM27_03275 [Leptospirales bacterium]|nr:hypothetical protein [Leptospirales bacterium]